MSCYNETKVTVDKQIGVLEERNELVLKQIEPLVDKYLNYETETLSKFKVDVNNLVALSMFPELKGNEFIKSQIDIVIKNQKEITKLKLQKASLNAYKLWLFTDNLDGVLVCTNGTVTAKTPELALDSAFCCGVGSCFLRK